MSAGGIASFLMYFSAIGLVCPVKSPFCCSLSWHRERFQRRGEIHDVHWSIQRNWICCSSWNDFSTSWGILSLSLKSYPEAIVFEEVINCHRSTCTGIWAGMQTVRYFDGKTYNWVGLSQQKSIFGKVRVLSASSHSTVKVDRAFLGVSHSIKKCFHR